MQSMVGHPDATAPLPAATGLGFGSNGACASGRAKVEDADPFRLVPRHPKNWGPPSKRLGAAIPRKGAAKTSKAQIYFGTHFDSPGCGILQSVQGWKPSNQIMPSFWLRPVLEDDSRITSSRYL